MARDIARRWLLGSLAAGLVAGMSGCASYYSHYAMFPAENSRGEPRQVRVSWLTAEYPDWWLQDDEATAIRVETQCSERVWLLRQAGADGAGDCGPGVRACAEPGLDRVVFPGAGAPAGACLLLNPEQPDLTIPQLPDQLHLWVLCVPMRPVVTRAGEVVDQDYLRASSVPYTLYPKRAPRGSAAARPPAFDESVCRSD